MDVQTVVGQSLFLCAAVMVGLVVSKASRLDITLPCLLAGVAAGLLLPIIDFDTGVRATNIRPLIFYVVLPVLIFEAAWHIRPAMLRRLFSPIFLLATVGLIISFLVIAVLVFYAVGHPTGFPWQAALLTGAILSATDPIAVVSALKKQQAPEELATLFEGESLFNDAAALVLFGAILSFATGEPGEMDRGYVALFAITFLGGIALGAALGLAAAVLVLLTRNTATATITLVFLAFSSFFIAEHFFHVSGIMSVVSAAVVSHALLHEHEEQFLRGAAETWDWLGQLFNGLIFVLLGLVITFDMFIDQWLAITIAIPAAFLGRALAVFSCGLITSPLANAIPMAWQYLLIWGGLRGAIAVVLVLSLPLDLPYWWTIQSMVFGVVLFTLLVQGTTMRPLIKRLAS